MSLATALILGAAVAAAPSVPPEPRYSIESEAFFRGAADRPFGFLLIDADARESPGLRAQALVWAGASTQVEGDAMIMALSWNDPKGRGNARVGRLLLFTGGLRPIHVDGVDLIAQSRLGTSLEVFGGAPVVPRLGDREFDWLLGGRLSQRFGDAIGVGVAVLHQRDRGIRSEDELAVDLSVLPAEFLSVYGTGAYDLIGLGPSELSLRTALHSSLVRAEVFAIQRTPSHLIPQTSIFSVLGDFPSEHLGGEFTWFAAPRLDLAIRTGLRRVDDEIGEDLATEATLRLDARGSSALLVTGQRLGLDAHGFWGARTALRWAADDRWSWGAEFELAKADHAEVWWPFARLSSALALTPNWHFSAGIETRASPIEEWAVDALVRATYRQESP